MKNLSLKQQEELERLKIHIDTLRSFVVQKSLLVSTIASLSATVLVVATFSSSLLKVTNNFKIALSALLLLIPISILLSVFEFHFSINATEKAIEEVIGKISKIDKKWYKKIFEYILVYFPFLGATVLLLSIIYIVYSIWV